MYSLRAKSGGILGFASLDKNREIAKTSNTAIAISLILVLLAFSFPFFDMGGGKVTATAIEEDYNTDTDIEEPEHNLTERKKGKVNGLKKPIN